MRNHPDGLVVLQARHLAAIENGEEASFEFDRGVGSLIENPPHMTVALRGAVALAHVRTLVVAWTGADPGGELSGRGKRRCRLSRSNPYSSASSTLETITASILL